MTLVETTRSFMRKGAGLAVGMALVVPVGAAHRPAASGISYKLTITTRPPDMMRQNGMRNVVVKAHGVSTGTQQRIDLESIEPNATLLSPNDYFLMLDTGKTTQVSPQNSIYSNSFDLSAAVGISAVLPMRNQGAGGMMSDLSVTRVQVKLDTLGGKDVISGYATRHFRITLDYGVNMAAQGEIPLHAVIEVWTAQIPVKLQNPFEQIAVLDSAGPMQPIFDKMAQIRAQMGGGVALKTETTTTIDISSFGGGGGGMPSLVIEQTSEFSDIKTTDVDPGQFTIPRGFSKAG